MTYDDWKSASPDVEGESTWVSVGCSCCGKLQSGPEDTIIALGWSEAGPDEWLCYGCARKESEER